MKAYVDTCDCGHALADHSVEPALDGRAGCRAAVGIARCRCSVPSDETTDQLIDEWAKERSEWHTAHATRVLRAALELDNVLAGVDEPEAERIRTILQAVAARHRRQALAFFCEHENTTSERPGEWECDDCGREFVSRDYDVSIEFTDGTRVVERVSASGPEIAADAATARHAGRSVEALDVGLDGRQVLGAAGIAADA